MKRILLVLFALISLNAFSQLQVKEGSFKHIPGGIIEDKEEYTDGNDFPMALIKISTENINEQERQRLVFTGNRETQIIKRPKTGQMWVYLSAEAATFIDIKHPDYGTCKYYLPEKLCDYCVYEMVLQYVTSEIKSGFLAVISEPVEADIYIDGKYCGKTVKVITDLAVGEHQLEISKDGFCGIKKTINIKADETLTINEKLQEYKEITIDTRQMSEESTTPKNGGITIEEEKNVDSEIYKVVEVMPEFPGGASKMMEFVQRNLKYPIDARENGIQGRVFVNFVVEPDGSITNITIMRGIGGGCDEEAIRVVKSMPKWKPGRHRGNAVRCSYTLPVIFMLN